jgi:hypothetical protein
MLAVETAMELNPLKADIAQVTSWLLSCSSIEVATYFVPEDINSLT